MKTNISLELFTSRFETEEECVHALFQIRWPEGFRCPRCQHPRAYLISSRRLPLFQCQACQKQTSLIAGTVMEGSRTPLRLWFRAILLHSQPDGINAQQLSNTIGVTYKTAWLICHKLRHCMSQINSSELLNGLVRISEAVYCKRPVPFLVDWHKQEQPLLVGASENDHGQLVHLKMEQQDKNLFHHRHQPVRADSFIRKHVAPAAAPEVIVTRRYGRNRNSMLLDIAREAEWWLGRLFQGIGPKHLQSYLDQFCYMFNRSSRPLFGELLHHCANMRTITYPNLINRHSITHTASHQLAAS